MELKGCCDMEHFVGEYKRYRDYLDGALPQLSDDEFFRKIGPTSNSVAIIMKHMSGNLKSRFSDFLTTDGEKPWRDRESEFDVTGLSREDLMQSWDEAWQVLEDNVFGLEPNDGSKIVTVRGVELTVNDALCRSLAHISSHVGEIIFVAKYFKGEKWTYLSVPPGGSEAYNQKPTREVIR